MDDFSQYFNALQEAGIANQIANIKGQEEEEQRQAIAPIGELISTEGIKEGISSTIETAKEMAISKAKDVASQAMKKAGIDDETIQSIISGNVKEAIMNKAQSLIGKAKGTAEEALSTAKTTAEEALSTENSLNINTAGDAVDIVNQTPDILNGVFTSISNQSSKLDGVLNNFTDDNVTSLGNDFASSYFSRFGNEFDEPGDLLEGTRPLFGSLRPPQIDLSMPNLTEGTPLSDLTGKAIPADLGDAGEDALAQLKTFIPNVSDTIASQVSNIVAPTTDTLTGIASSVSDTISGITSSATSAISGATDAISGAIAGATAGEEAATAATGLASLGADVALGPLGILLGLGAGIASLVESLKKPHEMEPVNAASQFL